MPKNWLQIKAKGSAATKDAAIELLVKAGSPGVLEGTYAPADKIISHSLWAGVGPEGGPGEDRSKGAARFTAYLDSANGSALALLKKELKRLGWGFTASGYREQDWSKKWKAGLKTIRIAGAGATIVVRPTWRKGAGKPKEIVIEIDPGMAFGTGGHETTRMCLRAILALLRGRNKPPKDGFLDVGAGTGVLSIAASKLGARRVVGIDIDPVALKVAKQCVRLNKAKVSISAKAAADVGGSYDIVAANILAGTLKTLSGTLMDKVRPGGYLILSGILGSELKGVLSVYEGFGMKTVKRYSIGEWRCAVLKKETVRR